MLTEYICPKEYYPGQILWYEINKLIGFTIVGVIDVKETKVEICVISTQTVFWVDKTDLREKHIYD